MMRTRMSGRALSACLFAVVLLAVRCAATAAPGNRDTTSQPTTHLKESQDASLASSGALVKYSISFANYRDHILHIECALPAGVAERTIQLPVWNALYQVRDFAQFVNWLRAKDGSGRALPVDQLNKSSWRIRETSGGAIVEYEVYADDPGPYGAQISEQHAFLNLAEVLVYPVEGRSLPAQLRFINVPAGWKFATSMPQTGEWYTASKYDQLVDAPMEAGTFREADFDEGGAHYRVVVDADLSVYNLDRIVADLHKIVIAATSWMNDRPYQSYVFIYHFPRAGGGGGMEHAYSTAIDLNAQYVHDQPEAVDDVSAHEFFHLWNVKRIRPQSLEPIDYTKENYTTALWFSEGVTSTAEDYLMLRAGLMNEARFLQRLGQQITQLEQRPAHLTQSAEDSSRDAWLEKYPYYFHPERSISYYNKGDLLGVMLDLAVRENSHGRASLRDVLQWMNEHYAKEGKFFPDSEGVRTAAEAVGGGDLAQFFRVYVAGTGEIPWDTYLSTVGLRVVRTSKQVGDPGFVAARSFDTAPSVLRVQPESEAARAGLAAGDTILELNGKAATANLRTQLELLKPGDTLKLLIRNRSGEHNLQWRVGSREEVELDVRDVDNVTAQQKARRAAWLAGESQPAEAHP